MRNFFYIFLGFLAGLIGILFSQVLLLIPLIDYLPSFFSKAALFLFPITSTALAVSRVWGEIFLNNPTRFKDNLKVVKEPTYQAIKLGIISGLVAGILSIFVGYIPVSGSLIKLIGWVLIGGAAGLAHGITWKNCTIEGSQKERAIKYMGMSTGAGFELDNYDRNFSFINSSKLRFNFKSPHLQQGKENRIEEGISIELPFNAKITIGSNQDSHICIPVLPYNCAEIEINKREVSITANGKGYVVVDNKVLGNAQSEKLKHNQILTFIVPKKPNENQRINFVRFVFYDRFLDRQA